MAHGYWDIFEFKKYKGGEELGCDTVYSIGGGSILRDGEGSLETPQIYPHNSFAEIADYCNHHNMRIPDYVEMIEGKEIWDYLSKIWTTMKKSVEVGLCAEGTLGGGLNVMRKARVLFQQRHIDESAQTRENRLVCAYAFAVSEQNASGGEIVTAPTCGSCGVLPSVLKYMQDQKNFNDEQIIRALATGGIIGNLIKRNASISGAECGCQAEIGTACSMAAAASPVSSARSRAGATTLRSAGVTLAFFISSSSLRRASSTRLPFFCSQRVS